MSVFILFIILTYIAVIYSQNLEAQIAATPTYCVNERFHSLLLARFPQVSLTPAHVRHELRRLYRISATEFYRAHDLLAYHYFVQLANPHRRSSCASAMYEYIPLLPSYWRPSEDQGLLQANVSGLIADIVTFMEAEGSAVSTRPRFTVASPFNFRTLLGTGMPTQLRRGYVYDIVTKFVTSMSIGHYERHPQCPDLLRKAWKYVAEVPYVPMNTQLDRLEISGRKVATTATATAAKKTIDVLFVGRLSLMAPESVCSLRNSIASLATMSGVMVVNISSIAFESKVDPTVFALMQASRFCLVTKADSYSSSSVYHALQAGCIPVVVSDWFVFSFPWLIPYADFTVRVLEKDFHKDPVAVIQKIRATYDEEKQRTMLSAMNKWARLLTFEPLPAASAEYRELQQLISNQVNEVSAVAPKNKPPPFAAVLSKSTARLEDTATAGGNELFSVLPFDLMLMEIHIAATVNVSDSSSVVPCYHTHRCTPLGQSIIDQAVQFRKDELQETRSYLCQHNMRLVGHYKMVYFMQCARVLWPLSPGKLKSADYQPTTSPRKGLSDGDRDFIMHFHNLSVEARTGQWRSPDMYPLLLPEAQAKIVPLAQAASKLLALA